MSSAGPGCVMKIFNYDYEELKTISLEMSQIYTDISLCCNDRFLVGSHNQGFVSVINLETEFCEVIEQPFGDVDTVWAAEVIPFRPEGEPQSIMMPSSGGLFPCILTEDG